MAFVLIYWNHQTFKDFIHHVRKTHRYLNSFYSWTRSHILKTVAKDSEALEKLLAQIQSWQELQNNNSFIYLHKRNNSFRSVII